MAFTHTITAVGSRTADSELTSFKWLNVNSGKAGQTDKAGMIAFVEKHPAQVGVGGALGWAVVQVAGTGSDAYLRTIRDGTITDNLAQPPRL